MNRRIASIFTLAVLAAACTAAGCGEPARSGAAASAVVTASAAVAPVASAAADAGAGDAGAGDAGAGDPACAGRAMLTKWALSPDGRQLLTSCWGDDCPDEPAETAIDVWDLAKGEVVRVLDARDSDVWVTWPSKDLVIANARKGTGVKEITVWDAHTFEVLHAESHYCAYDQVDGTGRKVLFTGCDGAMQLFDSRTRKVVHRPEAEAHLGGDYSVGATFSNDGQLVYVDDENQGFQLLDARTLRRRKTLAASLPSVGPDGAPRWAKMALAPSGKSFALLEGSGALKLLDATLSPRKTVAPAGAFEHVQSIQFLDEERIQLAAADGSLKIVELTTGKVSQTFAPAPPPTAAPVAPGAAAAEPPCRLWLGKPGRSLATATLTRSDCSVLVVDGKTLATKWTIAAVRPGPSGQPSAPDLELSPDERHLAAVFDERLLVVYEAESGREESRLQLPAGMSQLSLRGGSYRPLPLGWTADSRFVVVAQGEVFFVRPGDGAFVVLGMFAMGDKRVSVVATETEVEGPPELAGCAFQKAGVAGSEPVARRAATGVLGRFLSAR